MSRNSAKKTHSGQVESCKEEQHDVAISDYMGGLLNHDGSQIEECVVVVNTVTQQESACCAAHGHVETAAPATERAKAAFIEDLDVLSNAKMIEVLHRAFRIKGDEKYPLFLSPKWMRDGLTGIAIGTLSNIYSECQKAEEPGAWPEIDRETVWQTLDLCVQHFDDDIPELVLAQHAREWLTQWIIMASFYLQTERRDAAMLIAEASKAVPESDKTWHRNAQEYLSELPDSLLAEDAPEDDG